MKVGAAFCPMLQDLREYLEENPDIAVAPEWSETVRKSVRNSDKLLLLRRKKYTPQMFSLWCSIWKRSCKTLVFHWRLFDVSGLPAWDLLPPAADGALGYPQEKQTPPSSSSSPPPPPSPHSRACSRRPQPGRSWRGDSGLGRSLHDGWGGPGDLPSLPHQCGLWR